MVLIISARYSIKFPVKLKDSFVSDSHAKLKAQLDPLYDKFGSTYIDSDPIALVKRFGNPNDQEIVALIISMLAFGQVGQIVKAGEAALERMGWQPYDYILQMEREIELSRWSRWYYRMVKGSDILRLLFAIKEILKKHRSLAAWVLTCYRDEDPHLGLTWGRCVEELKAVDKATWKLRRSRGRGFSHLLPDPRKKSACKRAHLLLRWMVRKDGVDLGLWDLPANKLMIPVDTHIHRIAQYIGLTDRTDISFQTAMEITENLKILDPADPVKYDFALCRLGILKMCPKKRHPQKCVECPIQKVCRL